MQDGGGHTDPRITLELRVEMLEKLIGDLGQNSNPCNQRLTSRLTLAASKFETVMFTDATTKEEYERTMTQRPVTWITSGGDYIGPSGATRRASVAGPSTQNQSQRGVFHGQRSDRSRSCSPGDNYPVRRSNYVMQHQQPQASPPSLPQIRSPSLSGPLAPGHHRHLQAVPSQQLGQQQQKISISNHRYHTQQESSQSLHPQLSLLQQQPMPNYQQQPQQQAQIFERQASPQNHQLMKNKTIAQGSQTPAGQGSSRDQPITVSEDDTDWHDIAYIVLQKCKEACSSVVETMRHRLSRNHQGNAEMGEELDEAMRFVSMEPSGLAGITKAAFYGKIEAIYKMKEKHRRLNESVPAPEARDIQLESRDVHQEVIGQPTPVDKLINAVEAASAVTLGSAARDFLAVITLTDQAYNGAPDCADGRMKRDMAVMVACNFYAIDRLIDSGYHALHGPAPRPAKRPRIEVSGELMTEIELLNGSLIETRVAIVSPEGGWLASDIDDETTLACNFRAAGSAASNQLSHLFPVRMNLRIPKEYPRAQPTILSCRHGNCGQMCEELQTRYQWWSGLRHSSTVKEFVESWDECARELFSDVCSRIGVGSLREKFGSWQEFVL